MEKFRIVYYDVNGEASEAVVEADEGTGAVAQVEDLGRLCTVTSLGPVDRDKPEPGSHSYPWGSREERLAEQDGQDA